MKSIEPNEATVRRHVERAGYVMRKSRREIDFNNMGEFMLVDAANNLVVLGSHYDASLENIVDFVSAH